MTSEGLSFPSPVTRHPSLSFMHISYHWLRELIGGELPAPRELAERLTMAGLAVDSVRESGADSVLEFDLTSNRPDCLSHVGIAREAAALCGGRLRLPETEAAKADGRAADFTAVEKMVPFPGPRMGSTFLFFGGDPGPGCRPPGMRRRARMRSSGPVGKRRCIYPY